MTAALALVSDGSPKHAPDLCAAGKCAHAVSERVPCHCETCDADVRLQAQQRRAKATKARVAKLSEVSPRFRTRTFERFEVTAHNAEAFAAARRVAVRAETAGIGFTGPVGTGKSHLAAAIVNACIASDVPAIYIGIDDLLSRVRETYGVAQSMSENAMLRAYAAAPVLALDDIGKESLSDWSVRTFYALINRRYEQGLPLIVTSNFSVAQLAQRTVGNGAEPMTYTATIDRIVEMSAPWHVVGGPSRR